MSGQTSNLGETFVSGMQKIADLQDGEQLVRKVRDLSFTDKNDPFYRFNQLSRSIILSAVENSKEGR